MAVLIADPFVADPDMELYVGDARKVLESFPTNSADCVVTSPPYSDARRDIHCVAPDDFPDWLTKTLRPLFRVLVPTGSLMLNLGRRFRDGEELDYVERTLLALRADGWKRLDTIVWFKPNANGHGGPYLRSCHESVYWLATSVEAYRGLDDARRPYRDLSRYERGYTQAVKGEARQIHRRTPHPLGARADSVFVCSVGKEKGLAHPTPMPLELAEGLLVPLACPSGGTVLDPFAGGGTTLLAARKLGRRSIGIEINVRYAEIAARRLQQLSLLIGEGV